MEEQNFIDLPSPVEQEQEQETGQMEMDLGVTPEVPSAPAPVEQQAPEQAAPAPQEEPQEREAGKDGSVRDVAGAVSQALGGLASNEPVGFLEDASVAIRDWVDNTFQGDQLTTDQIRENRAGARAEAQAQGEEFKEQSKGTAAAAVADTLVRAVPGGALDAAEDVLSAAEVVGDTARYFATLGNVAALGGDPEKDNPFGSNYDWAQWKLGADEIGAQTQVGQFAQELVSFAAIGSRLGAFKSFNGTVKGASGVLKAGAMEALYGFAADAVKGLAGEGNFANMIESLLPGMKDTWVTALAVDEDDNPWEAAIKSGLDGMALGFPIGTIGAVAQATRAAKKVPPAQQAEVFAKKFAEVTEQQELALGNVKTKPEKTLGAHDVFLEASDGNYSRLNQLDAKELRSLMKDYDLAEFSSPRDILQNVDPFVSYEALGQAIFNKKLPNGSNIEWSLQDVTEQFEKGSLSGYKVHRIDWDISDADAIAGGLGREATQMFRQFSEVVSDTLKPGDIMMTEAAENGFGVSGKSGAQKRAGDANNVRRKLYQRAGFSEPGMTSDNMYGVVLKDKNGRARLQPLDVYGDVAAQVAAAKEGSAAQLSLPALDVIEERLKANVPVYWDDVAATMPEMFTPGTRAVQPDLHQGVYDAIADVGEGFTIDPFTGVRPEKGTAVAIDGVSLDKFDQKSVQDFIADNYDILSREDVVLGGWISEITGKPVIEISRLMDSFDEAVAMGKAFDQEGVFRLDDFHYESTGGIDKLKETKGFHQRSAYTTTNYLAQPGDPQMIARNLFTPNAPEGVSGGRLYTDSQIEKLADATDSATAKQMDEMLQKIGVSEGDILDQAKITRAELRENVIDDLASFLEDDGSLKKALLNTEEWGGEKVLTRQGQLQARVLIKNLAGRINEITRTIASKNEQGISAVTELENLVNHVRWTSKLRKRTVNALSIRLGDEAMDLNVQGAKAAKKQVDEMTKQIEAINIVDKELEKMVDGIKSGDPKRVRQAQRTAQMLELTGGDLNKMMRVTKGIPALYADVALKHMYNSLLSSPATHIVNTSSNILQTLLRPMTATLGGKPGAAQASFYGFAKNIGESWALAKRAAGDPSKVQGSKMVQTNEVEFALNAQRDKAIAEGNLGAQNHVAFLSMMNDIANFPLLSWPSKFLTTSDEFFKAMNARMEYNVRSYMEAQELASITPGAKQDQIFKELVEKNKQYNFGKETGEIINGELLDVAKELTFQTDMAGPVGKFMNFLQDAPYLRPFFPFVKTGHNIMVYTATHTPVLNLALAESRRALRGDLGAYAQAVHRGRIAMGSMFALTAAMAAAGGTLTGSGPKDPQRRAEWMKTHQPRSIKIGDKWVSYDRIEPFGQILSAMADITHMVTYDGLEEDKASYLGQYLIYAVSSNFTDRSFFQGIGQLAELINPGSGAGGGARATTAALNVVNNFIPASGLRRATVNGITSQMQEYYNNYDRVLIQMGLGSMVKPPADKKSWLDGATIDSASAGWWNALAPIKIVERGTDVVSDALEDIEFESRAVREELGGLKLHPEHQTRLNELIAESGVHAKIKKWVTDPKFKESVEQHKADMRDGKSTIPKKKQLYYSTIHRILSQAQTRALPFLLDEYPELAEQFHANKDLENRAKYGYVEGLLNTEY